MNAPNIQIKKGLFPAPRGPPPAPFQGRLCLNVNVNMRKVRDKQGCQQPQESAPSGFSLLPVEPSGGQADRLSHAQTEAIRELGRGQDRRLACHVLGAISQGHPNTMIYRVLL